MTHYVDNTLLSSMARCSTHTYMRHVLGYTAQEERVYLKCGSAAHLAHEVWLKGGTIEEAINAFYADYYEWFMEEIGDHKSHSPGNVIDILDHYFALHDRHTLPYRINPDMVEVGFAVPLDEHGDIVLTGRFDAAVQDKESGWWYVLDHKHPGRLQSSYIQHYQMDSQMSGYIWALEQMVEEPVIGALINVIELKKLPDVRYKKNGEEYKCKTHGLPYSECRLSHAQSSMFVAQRTPAQLKQWKGTALRLAQRYGQLQEYATAVAHVNGPWDYCMDGVGMEGQFNRACDMCEFAEWCAQGRQEAHVPIMMKHEPWAPFEMETMT